MKNNISAKEIEAIIFSDGYLTSAQPTKYLCLIQKILADYRSQKRKLYCIKRGNDIRYPAGAIIEFIVHRNQIKMIPQYDYLLQTTLQHGIAPVNGEAWPSIS